MRYVFFPTRGFISIVTTVGADDSLEVGRFGDEGMLGLRLLLFSKAAPVRALVQGPGAAWRIKAAPFCRELDNSEPLKRLMYRYLDVRLHQIVQTALCAHFHKVDARLARWLLTTADQMHSDQFFMTQQFISSMLGVRRAGVNGAASLLQKHRLIQYSRGRLTILTGAVSKLPPANAMRRTEKATPKYWRVRSTVRSRIASRNTAVFGRVSR